MSSDVEAVLAFLRRFEGNRFCTGCLALELRLSPKGVRQALAAIEGEIALAHSIGACTICGRRVVVSGLEAPDHTSPEERILEFLNDHLGQRFCQTCLASGVSLSIQPALKAMWRLRALPEVHRDIVACSACGRLRIVLGRDVRRPD